MSEHNEIDHVSGRSTTGHEWDGIKELNTPLPRWWVLTFYATILWAIGYWVVYPAWPLMRGYTTGLLHYTNRAAVATDLAQLEALRGEKMKVLGTASLVEIEKDPALLALARARGKTVFGDNCAPCHGSGAAGAKGYPNLNDDDWLWGGSLDQIMQTIEFGARSGHAKTHEGQMLAFGRDGVLNKEQIVTVANYVRSLSGLSTAPGGSMVPTRRPWSRPSPMGAVASCPPGSAASIRSPSRRWRSTCTRWAVESKDDVRCLACG